MKENRIIVGISGPSASGKTTVCEKLKQEFGSQIVHLDNYWNDPETIPRVNGMKNWELPQNLNFSQLLSHLTLLKEGESVSLKDQVYGLNLESPEMKPTELIIAEGFLLFHDKKVRDLLDYRIYIDVPTEVSIGRRIERGRNEEEDDFYVREIVAKEYKEHGLPTKECADLVVDGTKSIDEITREIKNEIKTIIQ